MQRSYYVAGTTMLTMSYLYYLLIYLGLIVALIGCEPLNTCYDYVSGVLGPAPEGWQRMNQVRLVTVYAYFLVSGLSVLWWVCLVCLFVCFSARITQKPHGLTSTKFLCMLTVAVAWSFSGGLTIHYVLPVLQVTSFFKFIPRGQCVNPSVVVLWFMDKM